MKSEKNILIAFVLNLGFAIFEFVGGVFVGSVAIISDAIHDMGDSVSIALSYFFERKSQQPPDDHYTYGYARFSAMGGFITNLILLLGAVTVIYNAIARLINPVPINYNGMIIFAVFGTIVNAAAAFYTRKGNSINQKAVNLHMLEDVLGWLAVLLGALVMKFTDLIFIDSVISAGVAIFILVCSGKNIEEVMFILLEKTPRGIHLESVVQHISKIDGVNDIHHVHIWSLDGINNCATLHIVTNEEADRIKKAVRQELAVHNINHVTLEIETPDENCQEKSCCAKRVILNHNHHHHHKHH